MGTEGTRRGKRYINPKCGLSPTSLPGRAGLVETRALRHTILRKVESNERAAFYRLDPLVCFLDLLAIFLWLNLEHTDPKLSITIDGHP